MLVSVYFLLCVFYFFQLDSPFCLAFMLLPFLCVHKLLNRLMFTCWLTLLQTLQPEKFSYSLVDLKP